MSTEHIDPRVPPEVRRQALERARKRDKEKDLEIARTEVDEIPSSGRRVFRFELFKAGEPNGPRRQIVLDEDGEPIDLEVLEASEERSPFAPDPLPINGSFCPGPGRVTVRPSTNDLVFKPGDRLSETIQVHVPADFGVERWDVYFLVDTTGSMGTAVAELQKGADRLASKLLACPDVAVGAGNYKDFPHDAYAFQHQLSPTRSLNAVTAATAAWLANGGADGPEAQLYALHRLATDPSIGWRPGAKRLVVWIGDQPGHEPVCDTLPGVPPGGLVLSDVIAALRAACITVVAIDLGRLDGDPLTGATDYPCGPGGSPGQASAITAATGGIYRGGVTPTSLVATICGALAKVFHTIGELTLRPSPGIAPFVTAVHPTQPYGPFPAGEDRVLTFTVDFRGAAPCGDEDRVFFGWFDVLCNCVVVGRKRVRITVPACLPRELYVYCVKFVCGVQEDAGRRTCTVRPGVYATEINIHNYQDVHACLEKRVVPVVFCGTPAGREPRYARPRATDNIVLPPGTATMDDCCRLGELLFGGEASAGYPLTVGFLEIESTVELCVTAVYTATGPDGGPVSIDVEQVEARRKRRRGRPGPGLPEGSSEAAAGTESPL